MTRVRFDTMAEEQDCITVPEGTYVVQLAEVRPGPTRTGDERWGLRLVVDEGEFTGTQAAWDGLSFSERGLPRLQRVLHAFGLPSEGEVDLKPEDLVHRRALAQIRPSEYLSPLGTRIRRNEVPYDGYRPLLQAQGGANGVHNNGSGPNGAQAHGADDPGGLGYAGDLAPGGEDSPLHDNPIGP